MESGQVYNQLGGGGVRWSLGKFMINWGGGVRWSLGKSIINWGGGYSRYVLTRPNIDVIQDIGPRIWSHQ